jgi:hypothetical protein
MLRSGGRLIRNFSVFANVPHSIITPDVEIVRPGTPGAVVVVHHAYSAEIESILASGLKTPATLVQEGKLEGLLAPRLEDRNDVIFFRPPVKPLTEKHDEFDDFIRAHGSRDGANWVAVCVNPANTFAYYGYHRKKNRQERYEGSRIRLLDLFARERDPLRDTAMEVIVRCPVVTPEWFVTDSRRYQIDLQGSCLKKQ